jgi:ABC-type glycerol-3-phosphate transport system permease component
LSSISRRRASLPRLFALVGLFSALAVLVSVLLSPAVVGAGTRSMGPSAGEVDLPRSAASNSTPFNNTTSHLSGEIGSFVNWFIEGFVAVLGFVVLVLLVGGILNYVLVGRQRGKWTPATADGLGVPERSRGPPSDVPSGGPQR